MSATRLMEVVHLTQQHRALASQVVGGYEEGEAERVAKKEEVEWAIAGFDAGNGAMLEHQQVAKAWGVAWQSWRLLESKVASRTISARETHDAHTSIIAHWLEALEHTRDASGLSLDPEGDGYFLHLAGLLELPNLAEQVGQLSSKGTGMLTAKAVSEADKALMTSLVDRVRAAQRGAFRALDKAAEYRPALRDVVALGSEVAGTLNRITALAEERIIRPARLSFSAGEFRIQTTEAIASVFKLADAVNAELAMALDQRSSRIVRNQLLLVSGVLLVAPIAGAVGVRVARSAAPQVPVSIGLARGFIPGDASSVSKPRREHTC